MKQKSFCLRVVLLLAVALPLAGFGSLESLFAPKAELWERWQAHDPNATTTIDHSRWTAFLGKHLSIDTTGLARLDYAGVAPDDRTALGAYIDSLTAISISDYSRKAQFAYWVNLYNALTVKTVLDHYPVGSIRDIDISPGFFADGPWGKKLIQVEGESISLNDIEHRILRPIWQDPRIHYAVNCASVGCPNLLPQAFTAANSETLLDQAARAYVNSPRGAVVNDDTATLSSIYVWFTSDFGGDKAGVLAHLRQYATSDLAEALDEAEFFNDRYDWSLNDVKVE